MAATAGAAIMAFELVGARLLMPSFGMGVEVWAAVITVTLGFLAIGYVVGGRLADAIPRSWILAIIMLLAGGALLAVRAVGPRVPGLLNDASFLMAAWASAAIILALPLLLLSMVQPVLARLMVASTARTGRVVGGLLAAGTIGSMVGTAGCGLVLLPRLGVSMTLFTLGATVASLSPLIPLATRRYAATAAALVATTALIMLTRDRDFVPPPEGPMEVIDEVEGRYGRLEVLEHKGVLTLACNGIFQTAIPTSGLGIMPGALIRGRDYTELIPYLRPGARSALLIGVGGGLHERMLALYGISVEAVEIEPAAVELARKHFDLMADVTIADGRAFLARDTHHYDAIILDTFLGGTVPEHLYTREAFRHAADRLEPGGILCVHLISRPQHAATRTVARTLETVFPELLAMRSGWEDELQHIYLFASDDPLWLPHESIAELESFGFTGRERYAVDTSSARVLTDDRCDLALMSRELVIQHRHLCLAQRRDPPW